MEMAESLALFVIIVVVLIITPITGFALLAIIRFLFKDRQLTKNILITIILLAIIAFLYPVGEVIYSVILIRFCRPECSHLWESFWSAAMLKETIGFSFRLAIVSLTPGFIISYLFTVPITLLVRAINKREKPKM